MKRKIAILMAIVLVVTALCCACGKDPSETQTSDTTTTTVPQETLKANEIFEKLRIVMEVNKTIAENPVYSIIGSDIGQIEFTCNGSNFVTAAHNQLTIPTFTVLRLRLIRMSSDPIMTAKQHSIT